MPVEVFGGAEAKTAFVSDLCARSGPQKPGRQEGFTPSVQLRKEDRYDSMLNLCGDFRQISLSPEQR